MFIRSTSLTLALGDSLSNNIDVVTPESEDQLNRVRYLLGLAQSN